MYTVNLVLLGRLLICGRLVQCSEYGRTTDMLQIEGCLGDERLVCRSQNGVLRSSSHSSRCSSCYVVRIDVVPA